MSDNLTHQLNNAENNPGKISTLAKSDKPLKKPAPDFSKKDNISQEAELKRRKSQDTQRQNLDQSHENELESINNQTELSKDNDYNNGYSSQSISNPPPNDKAELKKDEQADLNVKKKYSDKKDDTNNKDKKNPAEAKDQSQKDDNLNKDEKTEINNPNQNLNKPRKLGPQYEKENLKIPDRKSTTESSESNQKKNDHETGKGTAQKLNQVKNVASKALSGDLIGAGGEAVGATAQVGTQWLLTTLWGAVWLDWTLLTLLGLNIFLAFSLLLPTYVCQFGDDYIIGKWMPSKDLAKWTEIIILMIIDAFVLMIIILIFVLIYKMTTCGTWDRFNIFLSGVLPGGETIASAAQGRCF